MHHVVTLARQSLQDVAKASLFLANLNEHCLSSGEQWKLRRAISLACCRPIRIFCCRLHAAPCQKTFFFVWTCGHCPLRLVAMTLTQDLQAHDYAVLQLPIAAAPRIDRTPGHLERNSRIDMHWSWVRYVRSISNRKIPVPFRFWILFKTWEVMKMMQFAAFRSVHEALQGRESRNAQWFWVATLALLLSDYKILCPLAELSNTKTGSQNSQSLRMTQWGGASCRIRWAAHIMLCATFNSLFFC